LGGSILGGPDQNANLGIASFSGSVTDLGDNFSDKREGPSSLNATFLVQNVPGAFASLFFQWGTAEDPDPDPTQPTINLSQFRDGFLKFWIKASDDVYLSITSPDIRPERSTRIL